jgi:hypothetical protein
MAAPVALGSMLTSVLQRANLENLVQDANSVILKSEVRSYLNEALQETYDLLIQARGQDWYRSSYQFQTSANQSAYPLPANFYQGISVDINLGGNLFITGKPYTESERNSFRWSTGWLYNTPVLFRLLGTPDSTGANLAPASINFIPAPNSNFQVTLNYYPTFRAFLTDGTEDSNVFDGVNGWEGHAIWAVAAICLEKLKQDSSFARAQVMKFTERIEALAPDHHAGDPERVHDSISGDATVFGWI